VGKHPIILSATPAIEQVINPEQLTVLIALGSPPLKKGAGLPSILCDNLALLVADAQVQEGLGVAHFGGLFEQVDGIELGA
jgi:hypothetical protein